MANELNWEEIDFDAEEYCTICKKKRVIEELAYTPGLCAMAYKFSCGHIMVDDCNPKQLGGTCFRSEKDWEEHIAAPWIEEERGPGSDFSKFLKEHRGSWD